MVCTKPTGDFEISCFRRYVSVLVELSQLEGGGGRHGAILAQQMMDVAIRFVDSHETIFGKTCAEISPI